MAAFTTIAAGIGLGLTAAGAATSFVGAKGQAKAQQNITGLEMQAEAVRRQAMETDARRKQLEALRNMQRARSVALTNATSQGAQFGSGLQGGYGQIAGQTGNVFGGISEALQTGRSLFDINAQIGQQKIQSSQYGSISSTGSGLSSLGGAVLTSLPAIKGLSQIPFGGGARTGTSGGRYAP